MTSVFGAVAQKIRTPISRVSQGCTGAAFLRKRDRYHIFNGVAGQGDVIEIDVTDFVTEIYGEFNKELEKIDFSGSTANINSQIDKIAKTVNSYIDRANSWINRFNNLFAHLSNALQPVLLWSDGDSAGELGGIVSANYVVGKPVEPNTKLYLIPTTYSLELFAPAYKKSLIVTNAYKNNKSAQDGDATLKTAVQNLNKDLQADGFDLYSGTSLQKQFIFDASKYESGITFEIAYTAVDYEGQIGGRKCYITVGE